jgi:3-oxoacyl-[acyl-carrier protein] reductase
MGAPEPTVRRDLTDRVIVITGASAGIGRATALELAEEGARLVLGARRAEALDAVAEAARSAGAEVVTHASDLITTEGAEGLVAVAADRFGRVDGLVTSIGSTTLGRFTELTDEAWKRAFDMKFLATTRAIRAALPQLRSSGQGRIILVAGNTVLEPQPDLLTSSVINAALSSLAGGLARELAADGIGVVTVHPGPVRTGRLDGLIDSVSRRLQLDEEAAARQVASQALDGRVGEPSEVAGLIAYLLSPRAAHITGTSVVIDGGQTWAR